MSLKLSITTAVLAMAMTACTPVIHELRLLDANDNGIHEHDETITVEADVTVRRGGAETPVISTRPHFPAAAPYQPAIELTDRSLTGHDNGFERYLYSGQMNLHYGVHDLRLSIGYHSLTSLHQVSTDTTLQIEGGDSCFHFDDGQGLMGFTLSSVFNSDKEPMPGSVQLGTRLINWPEELEDHRSIAFMIDSQHFPRPPVEERFWYIYFKSPDLSTMPAWQQADSVSVRLSSHASGLIAQPILRIDGQEEDFAPQNAGGSYLFYPLSNDTLDGNLAVWNAVEWHFDMLPEGNRRELLITIVGLVGEQDVVAVPNRVHLDAVCPFAPISPPNAVVSEPEPFPFQ